MTYEVVGRNQAAAVARQRLLLWTSSVYCSALKFQARRLEFLSFPHTSQSAIPSTFYTLSIEHTTFCQKPFINPLDHINSCMPRLYRTFILIAPPIVEGNFCEGPRLLQPISDIANAKQY